MEYSVIPQPRNISLGNGMLRLGTISGDFFQSQETFRQYLAAMHNIQPDADGLPVRVRASEQHLRLKAMK